MSEQIAAHDKIPLDCGYFTVLIQSADDLRRVIREKQAGTILTREEFSGDDKPLHESGFDISYDADTDERILLGYTSYYHDIEKEVSSTEVMWILFDYICSMSQIDESMVDTSDIEEGRTIAIDTKEGLRIHLSCDRQTATITELYLYVEIPERTSEEDTYQTLADSLHIWGELHDFAVLTSGTSSPKKSRELIVHRTSYNDAAISIMTALTNYDQWRREIDDPMLPAVEFATIDMARLGEVLELQEQTSPEELFERIRMLAVELKKYDVSSITNSNLAVLFG